MPKGVYPRQKNKTRLKTVLKNGRAYKRPVKYKKKAKPENEIMKIEGVGSELILRAVSGTNAGVFVYTARVTYNGDWCHSGWRKSASEAIRKLLTNLNLEVKKAKNHDHTIRN